MGIKFMKNLFTSSIAEIDIVYRNFVHSSQMRKVTSSSDAFGIFLDIWSQHIQRIEEFYVLCLNRANKALGWHRVSSGGIAGTVADPKIIFQVALKSNASSIILGHNHPSGNIQPSDADIKLTRKMKSAGGFLDLPVLDHLIVDH